MTKEEAEEILERAERWQEESCSCHLSPPCSKCVEMPLDEEIAAAEKFLYGEVASD